MEKVHASMEAGACGFFGRNLWQRPYKDALKVTEKMKALMKEFPG